MATYQAVYDYKNSSSGMLSFRCGDKFLVRKKTNDDWWEVESENGTTGLVPVSYLELVEVRTLCWYQESFQDRACLGRGSEGGRRERGGCVHFLV